jgi:uncharacterized membrane protein YccF (DUF307 family)
MIGNPKWFNLRKYSGWGLTPNCWQGWAYIFAYIISAIIISTLPLDQNLKTTISSIILGVLVADTLHIMTKIPRDERELLHGAIADRNSLWFLLFALIIWTLFKRIDDPILILIILGATAVKSLTEIYLRDK